MKNKMKSSAFIVLIIVICIMLSLAGAGLVEPVEAENCLGNSIDKVCCAATLEDSLPIMK